MELTLRIRELRKARKMTLKELAEKIGVSEGHLSEIERGKKNLNNHIISRLTDALSVEPSDLIAGETAQRWNDLLADLEKLPAEDQERVRAFVSGLRMSQDRV